MEDSDAELVFEDKQKDNDKDEHQEACTSISDTNQTLQAIRHDSAKDDKTDVQDEKINESSNNVESAGKSKDDPMEKLSLQVYKCSKECAKFNGGMTS